MGGSRAGPASDGKENDDLSTLLEGLQAGLKKLANKEARATFIRDTDVLLGHLRSSAKGTSADKTPHALVKRHGRAMIRLVQGCLQVPESKDTEVQTAPYNCGRELLGVLTSHPGAVDVARLGLERLLYHAIARACDLQKAEDVVPLLSWLGLCVQGGEKGEDLGEWMDTGDCTDWGAEEEANTKKGKSKEKAKGKQAVGKGKGREGREEGHVLAGLLTCRKTVGQGEGGSTSLAKLVAGGLVNGLRCLGEQGSGRVQDVYTKVGAVLDACATWLPALGDEDVATANGYCDRVLRTAFRVASACVEDPKARDTAWPILERVLRLYDALPPYPPLQLLPQVLRAGLLLEKGVGPSTVLQLYDRFHPLLQKGATDKKQQKQAAAPSSSADTEQLQLHYLDYLRHHATLLLRCTPPPGKPTSTSSSTSRTWQALLADPVPPLCPLARALLLLQLSPLLTQQPDAEGTQLSAVDVVEQALGALASALEDSSPCQGLRATLLVRLWKALVRVLTSGTPGGSTAGSTGTNGAPSPPPLPSATLLSGSLALCSLSHLLLSAPPTGDPGPKPLHQALLDSRLRIATLLLSPSPLLPPSPSLPFFLPPSLPPPTPDPIPFLTSFLHSATSTLLSRPADHPPSSRRRLGSAWFTLGRAHLDRYARPLHAVGPFLQACTLLSLDAQAPAPSPHPYDMNTCQALQLDARFMTLALCLKQCNGPAALRWARRAAASAAVVSPALLVPSAIVGSSPLSTEAEVQEKRAAYVRKLVRFRILSHTDVAEAKAEKGRATAEAPGDLKQRLADEGQEWAWPLLTSLLGAGGEEQEEKKGRKGAKQKERETEGEEWSLYAALRRHHTEAADASAPSLCLCARTELWAYESLLQHRGLTPSQVAACLRGHDEIRRLLSIGEVEGPLFCARLLRSCVPSARTDAAQTVALLTQLLDLKTEKGEGPSILGLLKAAAHEIDRALPSVSKGGSGKGKEGQGQWVRGVGRAEQAAIAMAAIRHLLSQQAQPEEEEEEDREGDEESEEKRAAEKGRRKEDARDGELQAWRDVHGQWASEATQILRDLTKSGQPVDWPESSLGPREARGLWVKRTLEGLGEAEAAGGKMLGQAQLLELSLSMSALIGLHSEADAALHRPFVSVLYYLAGCVDLGEAYLPAEQDEERQPGPRKTGSKGSSKGRGKPVGPPPPSQSTSPQAPAATEDDDDTSEGTDEGPGEEEGARQTLTTLANLLAHAEVEGWPFTQARRALSDLLGDAEKGRERPTVGAWLCTLALAELEIRAGGVQEALHHFRVAITSAHACRQSPLAGLTWHPSSCVPACLLKMGRGWEELGVVPKARHYYEKAKEAAGRQGAWAVAEESIGRAALLELKRQPQAKQEDVEMEEGEGEEECGAALVRAERHHRGGDEGQALRHYEAAMHQLEEELACVGCQGKGGEVGRKGEEARAEIWRGMGQALHALERTGEAGHSLNLASSASGARAVDRALACVGLGRVEGEGRDGYEKALRLGRRTRCPSLYRQAGRGLSAFEGEEGGGDPDVRAFCLAASVGTTFWNVPEAGGKAEVVQGEEGWGLWEGKEEGWREVGGQRIKGLRQALPKGWTVCVLARDEGGRLALARVEAGDREPTLVVLEKGEELGHVMGEMRRVMEGNVDSMRGGAEVLEWGREEKANWWARREALDGELERLLWQLEESLGGVGRAMLIGQADGPSAQATLTEAMNVLEDAWEEHMGDEGRRGWAQAVRVVLNAAMVMGHREGEVEAVLRDYGAEGTWARQAAEKVGRIMNQAVGASGESVASVPPAKAATTTSASASGKARETTQGNRGAAKPPPAPKAAAIIPSRLTVADLRKELADRNLATSGLKAALVARLTEALANEVEEGEVARRAETPLHDAMMGLTIGERTVAESAIGEPADHPPPPRQRDRESGGKGGERGPMVLVLDESLQALPWESMPCLRGGVVTRCPSLAYVAAALKRHRHMLRETQGVCVEMKAGGGFYVLDPEANLSRTRATLEPLLQRCSEEFGWTGLVGTPPTHDTLREKLGGEGASMYVYCGHGSGELFWSRQEVGQLAKGPLAVLMGCSSGRLKEQGDFEPTGMVYAWLHAGSPAVVGNLWDVTDKDIDRFSTHLLEQMLTTAKASSPPLCLCAGVARAREACKLTYLVGAAPVVYGLPVQLTASAQSSVQGATGKARAKRK